MCCIRCTKCVGGLLLPLALLGFLANILLCFPSLTVLKFYQLSNEVTAFGGIIGSGIIIFIPAFVFLGYKKDKIRKCCGREVCGPRCLMFNSLIFAAFGVVGASYSFAVSYIAIKKGPKCDLGDNYWDYPFYEWNYLTDKHLWKRCLRPVDIVPWNLSLFSILMGVSASQLVLCAIQLINGILGTVFGQWTCDEC